MSNSIGFAGDIAVDKISIISVDGTEYSIANQVVCLQIYEDLYSAFITGTITVKDSLDFVNALPMIGQDILNLDISTPSLKDKGGRIDTQFYIYRIKNREHLGDKSVTYELDFISKEAITDSNVKISKSYIGKVSDLATSILTDVKVQFDSTKKILVEETTNSIGYISNFWSPLKNLNYLAEHALDVNNCPSFVFFENRDGFNFGSLNTLTAFKPIIQNFNYNSFTRDMSSGTSHRNINEDYKRIHTFSVRDGVNTLDRLHDGYMASLMITSDIVTKMFQEKYYNAFMGFETSTHLNKYPLVNYKFPIDFGAKILSESKAYQTIPNQKDDTNTAFIQKRLFQMHEKNDFRLNIVVAGRLDYTVGQVVSIDVIKMSPITQLDTMNDIIDDIYSGHYIITAINHYITRKSHECNMELAKDSYIKDFSKPRK